MLNKALQAPNQTVNLTAALFMLPFAFSSCWKGIRDRVLSPEVSEIQSMGGTFKALDLLSV